MGLAAGVTGALRLPPANTARTDASHFMMARAERLHSDPRTGVRSGTRESNEAWRWTEEEPGGDTRTRREAVSPEAAQRAGRVWDQFAAASRSSVSLTDPPTHTHMLSHTDTDPTYKCAQCIQTCTNPAELHTHTHTWPHAHTHHPLATSTLVTHNPSSITLMAICHFPRILMLSSRITLAPTGIVLHPQSTRAHTPPAVTPWLSHTPEMDGWDQSVIGASYAGWEVGPSLCDGMSDGQMGGMDACTQLLRINLWLDGKTEKTRTTI